MNFRTIDNFSLIIVFLYEKKSNRPHLEHGPHFAHDTNSSLSMKIEKVQNRSVNIVILTLINNYELRHFDSHVHKLYYFLTFKICSKKY